MTINQKDLATGVLFIAIGAFFMTYALWKLPIGSALQMGPAYFPLLVSGFLIAVGAAVAVRSVRDVRAGLPHFSLRIPLTIALAPIFFGLAIDRLGFLVTTAVAIFISGLANTSFNLKELLLSTVVLTALCLVIFYYGLELPVALFGTWLVND